MGAQLRLRGYPVEATALEIFVQAMEVVSGQHEYVRSLQAEALLPDSVEAAKEGIPEGDRVVKTALKQIQARDISETMECRRTSLVRRLAMHWRRVTLDGPKGKRAKKTKASPMASSSAAAPSGKGAKGTKGGK